MENPVIIAFGTGRGTTMCFPAAEKLVNISVIKLMAIRFIWSHMVTIQSLHKCYEIQYLVKIIKYCILLKWTWWCPPLWFDKGIWDPQAGSLLCYGSVKSRHFWIENKVKMPPKADRCYRLFVHWPSFCSLTIPLALGEPKHHFYSWIIFKTLHGCRNLLYNAQAFSIGTTIVNATN